MAFGTASLGQELAFMQTLPQQASVTCVISA